MNFDYDPFSPGLRRHPCVQSGCRGALHVETIHDTRVNVWCDECSFSQIVNRPNPKPGKEAVMSNTPCHVPECPEHAKSRGMCGRHYQRWLKAGSPADVESWAKTQPVDAARKPADKPSARKPRAKKAEVSAPVPALQPDHVTTESNLTVAQIFDDVEHRKPATKLRVFALSVEGDAGDLTKLIGDAVTMIRGGD